MYESVRGPDKLWRLESMRTGRKVIGDDGEVVVFDTKSQCEEFRRVRERGMSAPLAHGDEFVVRFRNNQQRSRP